MSLPSDMSPLTELGLLKATLERDEVCLLGLPFDVLNEQGTVDTLNRAVAHKRPCFLSTPNLNFVIAAVSDPVFRASVSVSDLSVADGMPLIWIAKLLGVPLSERVAGSSVFERMRQEERAEKARVFFFGGMDSVAEQAVDALNENSAGMLAVGSLNPGFGSVEDMSTGSIIDQINDAKPDFLVVSLGAKKGQSWITANRHKLNAPVVSHLGAVVNFVAGTVERAPRMWQKLGLEWVWRIVEEPTLWKRYFLDGIALLRLMLTRVAPLAVYDRKMAKQNRELSLSIKLVECNGKNTLILFGAAKRKELIALKSKLPSLLQSERVLEIDLSDLEYADASFWALMLRLQTEAEKRKSTLSIVGVHPVLQKLLRLNMLDEVLHTSP